MSSPSGVTPWTDQTAFEFAARKVIAQGRQSISEGGNCLYRGPDGLKCHIGHLIPDDQYSPALEGKSIDDVMADVPALDGLNLTCLKFCQEAHDGSPGRAADFVRSYCAELLYIAEDLHLDASFLNELVPA